MENFDLLQSFIFPYVNLAIFLVAAYFVLKGPILGALKSRRESYLALVERSNKAKAEAERQHQELDARLKGLDGELAKMRQDVKDAAEAEAKAIVANAEALAEHLKKEARRIAEAEVTAAKESVRKEILNQVQAQTAEELKRSLDAGRQHKIVASNIDSLATLKEVKA